MPAYTDQMGRQVEIPPAPGKIISLVPSQTELLFDLGLDRQLVGLTKFCIHPSEKVKQKVKVGGTKNLNISVIKEISPDLIIGNKEENERLQIEELMQYFPVWMSDISELNGAVDMMSRVGEIVGRTAAAGRLVSVINSGFHRLNIQPLNLKVAYLIWRKPYIAAGKGTFIDDMLSRCGLINAFDIARYPEISTERLIEANPEVIFLSSEPYPFKTKHITEFKALLPETPIKLVDGEMFSWYGSRLAAAPAYFRNLVTQLNRLE
jgi:ABC-type Fe3+-hydroxamate transport system substrate-binding protein